MAIECFLKIEGVAGEAKGDHEGEIDVLKWNWGAHQSGATHLTTQAGIGKVKVEDLSVTKYVDKSTPNLIMACCQAKPFPTAVLTCRRAAGDSHVPYLKIKMSDVMVSSVKTGHSDDSTGGDLFFETVTLNFGKVETIYTPLKPDRTADAEVTAGTFNIGTGKKE